MSEELVVERGVSRFGLERVHVVRWGEPVSRKWVEEVENVEAVVEYEEVGLGLWHLRVYWREAGGE